MARYSAMRAATSTPTLTSLAQVSTTNGGFVYVESESEMYFFDANSTIAVHPTLVIAGPNGGRYFKRTKRYVLGNFTLWITTVNKQVLGLSPGQQLASGPLNPDIVLSLPNFRQIGFGVVDSEGNLWIPDATLHAQGGRSVKFLLDDILETGTPEESVVITGVPVNDHNQSFVTFDKANNLWRGSSTSSIGIFQKIPQSSYRASGSPPAVTTIQPAASDWDDVNKYCIFDSSGNMWYCTSVEAAPIGTVTPQIGMVSAAQLVSGGVLTPAKVWSGSNFPTTPPANQGPSGLAFSSAGLLWTCAYVPGAGSLKGFDPSQATGNPAPVVTLTSPLFNGVNSLVFDNDGNLWVVEYDGGKVYMINKSKLGTSGVVTPDITLTGTASTMVGVCVANNPDSSGIVSSGVA